MKGFTPKPKIEGKVPEVAAGDRGKIEPTVPVVQVSRAHSSAWVSYRFGTLPAWLFLALIPIIALLSFQSALSSDLPTMIPVLAVGGAFCAWLGGLIPWVRRLGGPAITTAFLPSYAVYRHWLPVDLVAKVTLFTHETNFIYLYVTGIVVGSILGMQRETMLRGIARCFVPLLAGSALALATGALAGHLVGLRLGETLPMLVVPVMGGGVGEGAVPLSQGYAELLHRSPADLLSHLLPVVLFANFIAIVAAGVLNAVGDRAPRWTGHGQLELAPRHVADQSSFTPSASGAEMLFSALLLGAGLYLAGVVLQRAIRLPAAVTMLSFAVLLRLTRLIPEDLRSAAAAISRFTAATATYPLLFAVAVSLTPWTSVLEALHPRNLFVIVIVVLTLTISGFFVGGAMGLPPIEAALINACHTGSGGTGDVAILTAAERLELMPFAQVATRIGGALMVSLTLLIMRLLERGR